MGFGELVKFGVVSCLSAVGLNGSVDCSELFKWGSVTCLNMGAVSCLKGVL